MPPMVNLAIGSASGRCRFFIRQKSSVFAPPLTEAEKIQSLAKRGGPLDALFDDIRTLIAMVRDYASGAYREIPFGTIAAIVGALLYVLSPIDLIPDFIPGVGFIDDAAVVATCLRLVAYDIQKYRETKTNA